MSTPERATVMIAASETDSNLYYATKFIAPDPFIFLDVRGQRLLVMSDLEMDRARSQAAGTEVLSYSELEQQAKAQGVAAPGPVDVIHLVLQK
ncbi:MAG: aminopeptidase P family protein, partial [Nitrospira sp.]